MVIPDHAIGLPVLRTLSLCTCRRQYPGAAPGRRLRSSRPAVSAFPEIAVGSACTSTFSRLARRSLALRPAPSRGHLYVTRYTEGFSHFVTSMTAPVASGWSDLAGWACTHWKAPPSHGARKEPSFAEGFANGCDRTLSRPSSLIPDGRSGQHTAIPRPPGRAFSGRRGSGRPSRPEPGGEVWSRAEPPPPLIVRRRASQRRTQAPERQSAEPPPRDAGSGYAFYCGERPILDPTKVHSLGK